jgi:PI-3-kinase-related kinase SMG-1
VADLYQASNELQAIDKSYQIKQQELKDVYEKILKRLRWAAGNNKDLTATGDAFEAAAAKDFERARLEARASATLIGVSNAVAHFEAFRTMNNETTKMEQDNLSLIEALTNAVRKIEVLREKTDSLEMQLPPGLKNFAPDGHVTRPWMLRRQQELPKLLLEREMAVMNAKTDLKTTQGNLVAAASTIQEAQLDLNVIMEEIVPMLQPLIKAGDEGAKSFEVDFRNWYMEVETQSQALVLLSQLPFEEAMSDEGEGTVNLLDDLAGDEPAQTMALALLQGTLKSDLAPVASYVQSFYNQVLSLQSAAEAVEAEQGTEGDAVPAAAATDLPPESTTSQRNNYAVSIWRRVRAKLEGRVGPAGERLPTTEQVSMHCALYVACLTEGW